MASTNFHLNPIEFSLQPMTYITIYFTFVSICIVSGFYFFGIMAFGVFPILCNLNMTSESKSDLYESTETKIEDEHVDEPSPTVIKKSKLVYSIEDLKKLKTVSDVKTDYIIRSVENPEPVRERSKSPKQTGISSPNRQFKESLIVDNEKHWRHGSFSSIRSSSPSLSCPSSPTFSSRDSSPSRISLRSQTNSEDGIRDVYRHDPSTLPTEVIEGKIQWIHNNNGRIRANTRISGIRDIFFHFNDVEHHEPPRIGQNVHFNVAIYQKRLCATHIVID